MTVSGAARRARAGQRPPLRRAGHRIDTLGEHVFRAPCSPQLGT